MKVTYKDHYGDDLDVVNAARVSFSSESEWDWEECGVKALGNESYQKLSAKDEHLIKFLARGCTTKDWESLTEDIVGYGYSVWSERDCDLEKEKAELEKLLSHVKRMPSHWVPFANGGHIKMHFKVPLFVARQLQKHTAGFNPWSEVSRRYVDSDPEFFVPDVWRGRSADKKQGSSGVIQDYDPLWEFDSVDADVHSNTEDSVELYKHLLSQGVAPEQARMVLPQSMYTEFVWSGNLYAWASLYNTRSWGDSQAETAQVAEQIKAIVEPLFPVSWKELTQ